MRYFNGEIRQNYYFFARLAVDRELVSSEGELRFFTWEQLRQVDMPLSARQMMDHYLQFGRFTDARYAGITERGGARFVELQSFE